MAPMADPLRQGIGFLGETPRSTGVSEFFGPLRRSLGPQSELIRRPSTIPRYTAGLGAAGLGALSDIGSFGASALGFPGLGGGLERLAEGAYGLGRGFEREGIMPTLFGEDVSEAMGPRVGGGSIALPELVAMPEGGMTGFGEADPAAVQEYLDRGVVGGPAGGSAADRAASRAMARRGQPAGGSFADRAASQAMAEETDPVEEAFKDGMDEFIRAARGGEGDLPKIGSLEDYKKEFAEATGIDISGKPDKSAALMAFGLALMQNRAGSGFNVGNMLRSVGEAGEAALPALAEARKEARANAAAAGKYALEMRSADRATREAAIEKAGQRNNYYIVPKGEGVSGFLANMDKGQLTALNAAELARLQSNSEFSSQFDVLPGSSWSSIVEKAMETPEAKDLYLTSGRNIPLFEGVDDDLYNIRVFDANPNNNPGGGSVMAGDGQQQYEALARMARDAQKAREKFAELGTLVEGQNIFSFGLDKLNAYASAFGVRFGENMTDSQKIQMILNKLQAKNAPEILGESGKTISDGDRERVAKIVGELRAGTDPRELLAKIEGLFNDIVIGAENDIKQALSTLNRYTGRNIGEALGQGELSEEEEAERIEGLKALGIM